MVTITVSRQFGSGGRKVATEVARLLNYQFFDKQSMIRVAREVGISERELIDFSEEEYRAKGLFDRMFGSNVVATVKASSRDKSGTEQMLVRELDEKDAIDLVRSSVRAAYDRGNIVIVGRGGQHILQNDTDVFHVRIVANNRTRQDRLVEFEGYKYYETSSVIAERDKANAEYHRRFYNSDLDNPSLYHMVINTSKWSSEEAARLIVLAVKEFQTKLELHAVT